MTKSRTGKADRGDLFSRRSFLKTGGALAAGGGLLLSPIGSKAFDWEDAAPGAKKDGIQRYRKLGRTGFMVSDISLGCGSLSEPEVVRYAYDKGINYFDVAESYGNGDSEMKIGGAMEFMNRKKIFITTKVAVEPDTDEAEILQRFGQCLDRLKTGYADAFCLHSVANVSLIPHKAFHKATARLKADGKIRFVGISSHGPYREDQNSMEQVLCAAAEDGRFDLMLLAYNFLNSEEGDRVLACCKKNDVGTTAMKSMPGYLELDPFDPENPTGDYLEYIERMEARGVERSVSIQRIIQWLEGQAETTARIKPFAAKYGIKTNEELRAKSIQWILSNPEMHTVTVSMPDFESIDDVLPVTGTELAQADREFLEDYAAAFGDQYCRHACATCLSACPHQVPVSTIMRYSYYFARQHREKLAMKKYAKLEGCDAERCADCAAPCKNACPHGVNVPLQMMKAHSLLKLA
ncbi:MAG: aldo/keto reductase [Candidatus Eisenbacteria bacterium]|uniref:Aldo/keto reductase n=1 Tax=Eiseniibacteriota bacterium TaxID=2212470 RepID=A0A948RS31_UNCEI|nr:aldo/keto reductase [Candidatus Eisenbacteria bacterium]MBU1950261.1 aldo/keto reductase [Candidatus Eisenbacteria bacterium]MBU2689973.1 aldo/keto reductase [Candidatus Eisenbacteria bacterium]